MEENKKLRQEPAFPYVDESAIIGNTPSGNLGMSKRFYAACAAMGAMLSNSNQNLVYSDITKMVIEAYICADELLEQENL